MATPRIAIEEERFFPGRIELKKRLFSDKIDSDVWLMFHGTSISNASSIEQNGFSQSGTISQEVVRKVVQIFDTMRWSGSHLGGLAVLKIYSNQHDYLSNGQSKIYFAETSLRALLYASKSFAGGEKLRALRIALNELEQYLTTSSVRDAHFETMTREFRSYTSNSVDPFNVPDDAPSYIASMKPTKVDLDWLGMEFTQLSDVRQLANSALENHNGGVVYAVRPDPSDFIALRQNRGMGIESNSAIPASRIVAKIEIPADYGNFDPPAIAPFNTDERLRRIESGLLPALQKQ